MTRSEYYRRLMKMFCIIAALCFSVGVVAGPEPGTYAGWLGIAALALGVFFMLAGLYELRRERERGR